MKFTNRFFLIIPFLFLFTPVVDAFEVPESITLKTSYNDLWILKPTQYDFSADEGMESVFLELPISLPADQAVSLGDSIQVSTQTKFDLEKIKQYLQDTIAPDIYREATPVSIDMDESGQIFFEGTGHTGRQLDLEPAARMLAYALQNGVTHLTLPLIEVDPEVTINNETLKEMGIVEQVSYGETDFSGSSYNRIHNIDTGFASIQGTVIAPGKDFNFAEALGPVNGSTGYTKELVILGKKTVPDYGGGICQVSTTTYRAIMAGGYDITDRRNHSYLVSYYEPKGLDATYFEGGQNLVFHNDTDSNIVIQAFTEGYMAHVKLYGTKTHRDVVMAGPYYSNWRGAPSPVTEVSSTLAPGQTQVVGHAVNGVDVFWERQVTYSNQTMMDEETGKEVPMSFIEPISSHYQARPNYTLVGPGAPEEGGEEASPETEGE